MNFISSCCYHLCVLFIVWEEISAIIHSSLGRRQPDEFLLQKVSMTQKGYIQVIYARPMPFLLLRNPLSSSDTCKKCHPSPITRSVSGLTASTSPTITQYCPIRVSETATTFYRSFWRFSHTITRLSH